jgi:hypothetical protein
MNKELNAPHKTPYKKSPPPAPPPPEDDTETIDDTDDDDPTAVYCDARLRPYFWVSVFSRERDYAPYVCEHLVEALGRVSRIMADVRERADAEEVPDEVVRVDLRWMTESDAGGWRELYAEHTSRGSL